jgi:hypothetical protein
MSFISDLFAPSDQPTSLGARFRAKRQADFEVFFFRTFSKNEPIRILDLGGTAYFWEKSNIPDLPNVSITLLNLYLETSKHPHIETIMGDATELIDFKANEFDLVFSNSVIEHLYTKAFPHRSALCPSFRSIYAEKIGLFYPDSDQIKSTSKMGEGCGKTIFRGNTVDYRARNERFIP